jgi:hypothetical protein
LVTHQNLAPCRKPVEFVKVEFRVLWIGACTVNVYSLWFEILVLYHWITLPYSFVCPGTSGHSTEWTEGYRVFWNKEHGIHASATH